MSRLALGWSVLSAEMTSFIGSISLFTPLSLFTILQWPKGQCNIFHSMFIAAQLRVLRRLTGIVLSYCLVRNHTTKPKQQFSARCVSWFLSFAAWISKKTELELQKDCPLLKEASLNKLQCLVQQLTPFRHLCGHLSSVCQGNSR